MLARKYHLLQFSNCEEWLVHRRICKWNETTKAPHRRMGTHPLDVLSSLMLCMAQTVIFDTSILFKYSLRGVLLLPLKIFLDVTNYYRILKWLSHSVISANSRLSTECSCVDIQFYHICCRVAFCKCHKSQRKNHPHQFREEFIQ